MSRTTLTFAELTFLLSELPETRQRIHLNNLGSETEIRAAGLASLIARGLATVDGDSASPVPELARMIEVVSWPKHWVDIAVARGDLASGIVLSEREKVQVAVTRQPFGTWELGDVGEAGPLAEVTAKVVQSFLGDSETGAAFIRCDHHPKRALALETRGGDQVEVLSAEEDQVATEMQSLRNSIEAVRAFVAQ